MISSQKYARSSVSSPNSAALSDIPFATVRMVPSFGFITALYAVSVAFWKASEIICTFSSSYSAITFVNPRNNWDKITPELPLAPRNDPEEIAFANEAMVGFSIAATSFAADIIVIDILVPVSPSGTGNTFSSLIHSFLASKLLAPARNILAKSSAFIVVTSTFKILLNQLHVRLQRKC